MIKQKGGTWLGVLLGLLVGLVLAVGFAWFLTRNSSKVFKPESQFSSGVETTERNGRGSAGEPISGQAVKKTGAVVKPTLPTGTQMISSQKKGQELPEHTSKASEGEKIIDKDKKIEKTVGATTDIFLQLGAFKNRTDAEKLVSRIKEADNEIVIEITQVTKDHLYKVKVGPFKNKEQAQKTKEKLALAGFEAIYSH